MWKKRLLYPFFLKGRKMPIGNFLIISKLQSLAVKVGLLKWIFCIFQFVVTICIHVHTVLHISKKQDIYIIEHIDVDGICIQNLKLYSKILHTKKKTNLLFMSTKMTINNAYNYSCF
jgi:hypothetical protein